MLKQNCKRVYRVALAALLLFTGCGEGAKPAVSEDSLPSQSQELLQEEGTYYILEEKFLPSADTAIRPLVGEMEKYVAEDPVLHGDCIYRYVIVLDEDAKWKNTYLQVLSLGDEEWQNILCEKEFELEGRVYSGFKEPFFSEGEKTYSFVYAPEEDRDYLGRLGMGGIEEILCPIPEKLLEDESHLGWRKELVYDMAGNFYSFFDAENSITVFDDKLQARKELALPGAIRGIVQSTVEEPVYWYGADEEGMAVIQSVEGKEVLLRSFDGVQAYGFEAEFSLKGTLFIADSQSIWKVEKEPEEVFNFIKKDYIINDFYGMEAGNDGTIRFLVKLDGSCALLILKETDIPPAEEKQEVVIAFAMRHLALERSIARFNRQSSQYHVSVMLPEENEEAAAFRDRIQLEVSTKKGPDILGHDIALSMTPYVENGYLECLDGLLEEEAQYLSAALEGCRIDGKLYGIPYDCTLSFVAYPGVYVKEGTSWSVEELMEAVQISGAKILQGEFDGVDIVRNYGLNDNSNTAYIDWEKGESHLTEAPFLELLAFAKEYADTGMLSGEKGALAAKGEAFAVEISMDELQWLHYANACFAEDASVIGYPRKEGNGIYVSSRELYVNSSSACKEGAKEFLRFLLSEDEQKRYIQFDIMELLDGIGSVYGHRANFPVHMGAYEALIDSAQGSREVRQYLNYGVSYEDTPYTEKEVEQFRFLLEHAQPNKPYASAISRMISEELEPYFAGAVTAETAAEKLDNRVQLYLDERVK